jgi:hypothetical protein
MALNYKIWCDVGYIHIYNADTECAAMSWHDIVGILDYWPGSLPAHPVCIPDFERGDTAWL